MSVIYFCELWVFEHQSSLCDCWTHKPAPSGSRITCGMVCCTESSLFLIEWALTLQYQKFPGKGSLTLWMYSVNGIWHARLIFYSLNAYNLLEMIFFSVQYERVEVEWDADWERSLTLSHLKGRALELYFWVWIWVDNLYTAGQLVHNLRCVWSDFLLLDVTSRWPCYSIVIFTFWGSCWPRVSLNNIRPMISSIPAKFWE